MSVDAALTANALGQSFAARLGATLDVVYGVSSPTNRIVGLPTDTDGPGRAAALARPPKEESDVVPLGRQVGGSQFIATLIAR